MSAGEVNWGFAAKRCRECLELKALTEENFYVRERRTRKRDGKEVIYWDCYCRKCRVKRSRKRMEKRRRNAKTLEEDRAYSRRKRREYRAQHPEREREANAKQWERIKNDPDLYEEYINTRRADFLKLKEFDPEAYVALRQDERINPARERSKRHRSNAIGAYRSTPEKVDPEPFRRWIAHTFPHDGTMEIARRLGLNDRHVRRIIEPQDPLFHYTLDLRVIDRALVNFGRPDILNELYPLEEAG